MSDLWQHDNYTQQEWMEAYHKAVHKFGGEAPRFSWIVRDLKHSTPEEHQKYWEEKQNGTKEKRHIRMYS